MAPLGVENPYWRSHLRKRPSCTARLLKKVGETVPKDKEVFSRWKILAEPDVEVNLSKEEFKWLGKEGMDSAIRFFLFCWVSRFVWFRVLVFGFPE